MPESFLRSASAREKRRVLWREGRWSDGPARAGESHGQGDRVSRPSTCPLINTCAILVAHYVNMFTCASLTTRRCDCSFLLHYGWSVYLVKLSNSYTNKSREYVFLLPLLLPYNNQIYFYGVIRLAWDQSRSFKKVLLSDIFIDKGMAALNL